MQIEDMPGLLLLAWFLFCMLALFCWLNHLFTGSKIARAIQWIALGLAAISFFSMIIIGIIAGMQ